MLYQVSRLSLHHYHRTRCTFDHTHSMLSCIWRRSRAFFLLTSVNHWASSCSSVSSASGSVRMNINDNQTLAIATHNRTEQPSVAIRTVWLVIAFNKRRPQNNTSEPNKNAEYVVCL